MLIEEKSNLARLMATENLIIEEKNVSTAYFDLKNRILTVPVLNGNLSSNIYDLFMGHEVGHALETPIEGYHDSVYDHGVNHTILNVCEDVRIEKKMKRKFPGLRYSFLKAYQELVKMNFFSIEGKDVNKFNLIDRINLQTKVGSSLNIEFSEDEQLLLEEAENTETFEEVVEVAKKIQKFMQQKKRKNKAIVSKPLNETGDEEESNEEEFDFDDSSDEVYVSSEDDNETKEKEQRIDSNSSKRSSKIGDYESIDSEDDVRGSSGSDSSNIESQTHNAFRSNEEKLFVRSGSEIRYCNIPKIEISEFVISPQQIMSIFHEPLRNMTEDMKQNLNYYREINRKEYQKFKTSNEKVVSYLAKEFEMRKNAEQHSRAKISKSGEINMSKISNYHFTDDIFKKIMTVPNGKSHGLVMFIDWSGSMAAHIHSTIKQMLTLVLFCRKVNIPFEVYAFTTSFDRTKIRTKKITKYQQNDLFLSDGNFALLNFFNNKMKNSEINEMASYLHSFFKDYTRHSFFFTDDLCLGGTPLNEAIVSAFEIIPQFKKNNNLQIVNTIFLTDGDGQKITDSIYPKNAILSFRNTYPTKTIIRDKKNKCQVDVLKYAQLTRNYETIGLIQLLKQRIGGNIISFYITSVREVRSKIAETISVNKNKLLLSSSQVVDDYQSNFRKEGSIVLKSNYYDEMYMIKSDSLELDGDSFVLKQEEDKEVNVKKLASAFTKYNEGKFQSRSFLNRFIKIIS
jgi:hypothetical protein